MIIGDRLRALREEKKFSQGDIEKRTGLLRCYISRVENGHTVPAIETLEKMARALEVPLYQLFYDGEEPPELPNLPKRKCADDIVWGSSGKEARFLNKFRRLMGRIEEGDRRSCFTWPRRWPTAKCRPAGLSDSRPESMAGNPARSHVSAATSLEKDISTTLLHLLCVTLPLLFPFNRARRFRADVVDHSVDSAYFVYDSRRNAFQHFAG